MKSKGKSLLTMMLALTLIVSLFTTPCGAAVNVESSTEIEDLGNGITMETVLTVQSDSARSSTKSASLTRTYKNNGTQIAVITLNANFVYDGTTSRATYASYSKNISSGWTYANHSLTRSGGTAKLTANLKKTLINVPVSMSITCSPSGVVSKT